MEEKLGLLRAAGLDTSAGIACTGSPEKYSAALRRFAESSGENTAETEDLLAAGDIEGFGIKVHAMKSNAKMIGASELAGAYERLELAAERGDTALIAAETGKTLEAHLALAGRILPITGVTVESAAPALTAAEASETAEKLLAALDDFDDELSAELARKLSGFPFDPGSHALLDTVRHCISEFDYDSAAENVKQLKEELR